MKSVLIISPAPTHPTRAGNRARILNMADQLRASGVTVSFLYLGREGIDQESLAEMHGYFTHFWYLEAMREGRIPAEQVATSVYAIDDWMTPDLTLGTRALLRGRKFDAVIVNYVMYSRLLNLFDNDTVKVLDTHDRMGGRHEVLDAAGIARNFFWTTPEEEAKALRRADIVLAIQEEEASYFTELGAAKVLTLGHKPIIAKGFQPSAPREKITFGAVGSDNAINRQYFTEMLREWPADGPTLRIAGSVCRFFYAQPSNVELLGSVEDLPGFYESVDVVLNPIAMGTGLKIKTLEALSYGKPLVSTLEGMRGLEALDEAHRCENAAGVVSLALRIATDKEALARATAASKSAFTSYVERYDASLHSFLQAARLTGPDAEGQPRLAQAEPSRQEGHPGGVWTRSFIPAPPTRKPEVAAAPVAPAVDRPRPKPKPGLAVQATPAVPGEQSTATPAAAVASPPARQQPSPTSLPAAATSPAKAAEASTAAGQPVTEAPGQVLDAGAATRRLLTPPFDKNMPGSSFVACVRVVLAGGLQRRILKALQKGEETEIKVFYNSNGVVLGRFPLDWQAPLALRVDGEQTAIQSAEIVAISGDSSALPLTLPLKTLVKSSAIEVALKRADLYEAGDFSKIVIALRNFCLDAKVEEAHGYRLQLRLKGGDRKTRLSIVVALPSPIPPGETLIAVPVNKAAQSVMASDIKFTYIDFIDAAGHGLRAGRDEAFPPASSKTP